MAPQLAAQPHCHLLCCHSHAAASLRKWTQTLSSFWESLGMGLTSLTLLLVSSDGGSGFSIRRHSLRSLHSLGNSESVLQQARCIWRSSPFALSRPAGCGLSRGGDSVTSFIFKTLPAAVPEVLLGPRPGQALPGSGGQIEVWRLNKALLRNFSF